MTIVLKDGFEVSIDEKHINDWELLRMIRNIDKGELALVVDVAEILLGEDQMNALAEHLKVDGVTPITAMVEAMREIMESASSLKNS